MKPKMPQNIKETLFLRFWQELTQSANSPRAYILVAHAFIETLIDALAEEKLKTYKDNFNRDTQHSTRLHVLYELDELTEPLYTELRRLGKLRNAAAHEPVLDLENHPKMITYQLGGMDIDWKHGVADTVINLWNMHSDFFFEKFGKHLIKPTGEEH